MDPAEQMAEAIRGLLADAAPILDCRTPGPAKDRTRQLQTKAREALGAWVSSIAEGADKEPTQTVYLDFDNACEITVRDEAGKPLGKMGIPCPD